MTEPTLPPAETQAPGVVRPPHLLWALGFGAGGIALLLLIGLAVDRWPFDFDRDLLLALREPGNLAQPIGPAWLERLMLDVTVLGGRVVLTLAVIAVVGLLAVRRLWLTAVLVAVATALGSNLSGQAKLFFGRPRPDLVDHLVTETSLSFPSGHATNSAVIYLTIALLVSQVAKGRWTRFYVIAGAVALVGMIGISRVYLGVHWPSDVLAGWSIGTCWALAWWFFGAWLRNRLA